MAETLASGRNPTLICPIWLLGWVDLCKKAAFGWLDDHGCGNRLLHSILAAPMLIGVAGVAFGREAAEGALFGELTELIGPESAAVVQAMLRSG